MSFFGQHYRKDVICLFINLFSDIIASNLWLFRLLASIAIFLAFWCFKALITKLVVKGLDKVLNRKRQIADHATLTFVLTPLKTLLAASGIYLALINLDLGNGFDSFWLKAYRISFIIVITWILLRLCECTSDSLFHFNRKLDEQLDVSLDKTIITLLKKIVKVLILIVAGIAVLSETGINVTTVITGIGLGGLTFALAS